MLKKRAQGMSIRTILIAVLGLIVLVVVITLLSGKIDIFKGGTDKVLAENAPGLGTSTGGGGEQTSCCSACGNNERCLDECNQRC